MAGGWPGLPQKRGFLRARIWLVVIALASVAVLTGLHLVMSYLELGWCDDRHDLPGACTVVRAPVDWFNAKVVGMPDEASCATPLDQLRGRGARVWVTHAGFLPDGGVIVAARFAMKRGAVPQKLARLRADGSPDRDFPPSRGCAPQFRLLRIHADGTVAMLGGAPDGSDDLTRLTLIAPDGASREVRARGACAVAAGNIRDVWPEQHGTLLLAGEFEAGPDKAVLARLESDGRCVMPFEAPAEPLAPETIAGVLADGRISLRLRPPQELPLLRYMPAGSIDLTYSAALQQSMLETGMPVPREAMTGADGSTVLTFPPEIGISTVVVLDPNGQARPGIPAKPEALERRIGTPRPLDDGSILLPVDGRSRETAETLRVSSAKLWRMLPDGQLDEAFYAATKELAPGAGDLRVLDVATDGRLLVHALWYGVPPQPYSWPWPVRSELYVLDRTGNKLASFNAPGF
jgi:hypothetical protein